MIKTFSRSVFAHSVRKLNYSDVSRRTFHFVSKDRRISSLNNHWGYILKRGRKHDKSQPSQVFVPIQVKVNPDDINIGAELTGKLEKQDLLKVMNSFYHKPEIKLLCLENGLDDHLLHQAFLSFRKHCLENDLSTDLHVTLSDILQGAGHVDDLYPYFIRHAKLVFPHLDCIDDLKQISDLRTPANWYPAARAMNRRVIFHAGPTNSGKTYHAMQNYLEAESGVYCGPLKLLATEIYHKSNKKGTRCDLITGEERRFSYDCNLVDDTNTSTIEEYQQPADHVSCTVEMTSLNVPYEVAIIDEIQLIADKQRGWAWTRAILGLQAKELHLCGEAGAIPLIQDICNTTGEELEIKKYERLTKLHTEDSAVVSLDNILAGDCIVCFNKNDIYSVSRSLENRGKEVAVIYGSLPPGTKLAQANKFNDPESSCKVMVATDAIGLGINLSIRRIIFYSLLKPTINEKGEKQIDTITVSQALQIAGRAGRYGSIWETGYVTTFRAEDLATLKSLMAQTPEIVTQAGLHPTAEQMELYAYHLPHASLSSLMDIFVHLCTVDDSLYFMCNTEAFKFLAEMIQHVPLPLRARYVFCCAPINQKVPFVCALFLKMVRQYSRNDTITWSWICNAVGWPLSPPKTIVDLVHLEAVFDGLDLYLWLSYRFQDLFPDAKVIRDMQGNLDILIQQGIIQITRLLRNSEAAAGGSSDEETIERLNRRPNFSRNFYHGSADSDSKDRLSDRLIAQGLLTPRMLNQLRSELSKTEEPDSSKRKWISRKPRK